MANLNRNSPPAHHGFLKFYYNIRSFDLFPNIPEFQIEFGQTAVVPIAKTSDFGVLSLDGEFPWVFLTSCMYGGEIVYKAASMESGEKELIIKFGKFVSPSSFNYVFDFDLSCCHCLLSGHLEQLAIACRNLRRLNLQSGKKCRTNLQGLQSIASYCSNLQGLNLIGIPEVEDKVQFWEMLSGMGLTHLALELCLTEPSTAA